MSLNGKIVNLGHVITKALNVLPLGIKFIISQISSTTQQYRIATPKKTCEFLTW